MLFKPFLFRLLVHQLKNQLDKRKELYLALFGVLHLNVPRPPYGWSSGSTTRLRPGTLVEQAIKVLNIDSGGPMRTSEKYPDFGKASKWGQHLRCRLCFFFERLGWSQLTLPTVIPNRKHKNVKIDLCFPRNTIREESRARRAREEKCRKSL